MTASPVRPALVNDAIVVDEVGIEIGVYEPYRVKSSYQPIFERSGDRLIPVAVEGQATPFLRGRGVPLAAMIEASPPRDAVFIGSMGSALALRNHRNIGVDRLDLHFRYEPPQAPRAERSRTEVAFMLRRLPEFGLSPSQVVCEIVGAAGMASGALASLVSRMREIGFRIALDDFAAGYSMVERLHGVCPDVVRIDGAWFRRVVDDGQALALFHELVGRISVDGAKVFVGGIERHSHLAAACDAGVHLFQGGCLAKPGLAGTVLRLQDVAVPNAGSGPGGVVPLFA